MQQHATMQPLRTVTILALCVAVTNALALVPHPQAQSKKEVIDHGCHESAANQPPRPDALRRAFLFIPVATVAATTSVIPPAASALEGCRPKSHNCIRTTWTAPASITSAKEAAGTIQDVLNSYPQKGQAGVDCSGWRLVDEAFDGPAGVIKLEYKSCVGPAALAINLGQPFIDDVTLELVNTGSPLTVEVKSASRMGASDLGVNRKRLEYLGRELRKRGWSVPDPKYVYEL